jgi:molecular chaperone IbpA
MATTASLAPLFRQSVGFDRFNDFFESALHSEINASGPPHNVERYGNDHYRIVIATAGLAVADLDLTLERDVLTVCGGEAHADGGVTYLHQGIAHGPFRLVFHLADHIEVQGATFLLRVEPQMTKARRINIHSPSDAPDRPYISRP